MTAGSLFAGIGGFDLGLERAGLDVRWQVEIDPFCRAVLARHWPQVRRYEDVRTVDATNLERVDLICGGFPCQDISYAGNRLGLTGQRSGLWFEFARIIRDLAPGFVVVENVSALLDCGMGDVLGTLADIGYDAEWHCIPASAFGAPHARDRVWIIAYPDSPGRRPIFDVETWLSEVNTPFLWQSFRAVDLVVWLETYCGLHRNVDGLSGQSHRIKALGNSIVPQVAEWIGHRIVAAERARVLEKIGR